MSKAERLINYIEQHGSITSWEVHEKFRTTTPSKVISDARVKCSLLGKELVDAWETHTNKDGDTVRFKRYSVKGA